MNAPASPLPLPPSPELIYGRYSATIERLIRRVLGTDSEREDLRQDVLMTVLRKAHTVRDPECMDFWVRQVTINTLKYTMRQRRLRRHPSVETLPEAALPTFQTNFESREIARRAVHVLERVPRNDRALLLRYWLGSETAEEIALRSGCSTVTVRRKLTRARCRFERLARQDPELARCLDDPEMSPRWSLRASA